MAVVRVVRTLVEVVVLEVVAVVRAVVELLLPPGLPGVFWSVVLENRY